MNQRRQRRALRFVQHLSSLYLLLGGFVCASSNDASSTTSVKLGDIPTYDTEISSSLPPSLKVLSSLEQPQLYPVNYEQQGSTGNATYDVNASGSSLRNSSSTLKHLSTTPRPRRRRRSHLWTIPFLASAGSFVSFKRTSRTFHGLVQWMSGNTWIPKTFKELNLQANIVTQVINGPVITSISVLFASLVSMTISSLYQRQSDIRLCLTNEIQALRILQTLLHQTEEDTDDVKEAQQYLQQYIQFFTQEINSRGMKLRSNWNIKESNNNKGAAKRHVDKGIDDDEDEPPPPLWALLAWCQQDPSHVPSSLTSSTSQWKHSHHLLYANVSDWVCRLWSERSHRHLALSSVFPMVHYITLTFLAIGIGIAFLVATDQSTSIFLEGMPVRILWSILMGSFTALAVVCYDLSAPFGGAYQVTTTTSPWV